VGEVDLTTLAISTIYPWTIGHSEVLEAPQERAGVRGIGLRTARRQWSRETTRIPIE
jgi:hypothetical protein